MYRWFDLIYFSRAKKKKKKQKKKKTFKVNSEINGKSFTKWSNRFFFSSVEPLHNKTCNRNCSISADTNQDTQPQVLSSVSIFWFRKYREFYCHCKKNGRRSLPSN